MSDSTESQLLKRLRRTGYPLDHRQDGWRLVFATLAVVDWGCGEFVTTLCREAIEKFIDQAPDLNYCSALQGITYFPYLTAASTARLKKPLTVGPQSRRNRGVNQSRP